MSTHNIGDTLKIDSHYFAICRHSVDKMAFTGMTIHCIRDGNNSSEDDKITIHPVWTSLHNSDIKRLDYCITHSIPASETYSSNTMTTESIVFGWHLVEYISNLIKLLAADTEPFVKIQICIPSIPSVMLSPKGALEILPSIVEEVKRLMSKWPEQQRQMVNTSMHSVSAQSTHTQQSAHAQQSTHTQSAYAQQSAYAEPVARHLFFDEEDGRVIGQFN